MYVTYILYYVRQEAYVMLYRQIQVDDVDDVLYSYENS